MNNEQILRQHPDDVFGPKIHPLRAGVFFKKDIQPWMALDEFHVALDIWFGYMDDNHKRKALDLVKAKAPLRSAA